MAENDKSKKLLNKKMREDMKKKPVYELIDGVNYYYSLLEKKSESGILNHERLFTLHGNQSISYARTLPDNVILPFTSIDKIPESKVKVALADVDDVTNDQEILVINLLIKQKKDKWQFKCSSKNCAIEWRQKIEAAIKEKDNINQPVIVKIPEDPVQQHQNNQLNNNQLNKNQLNKNQLNKEEPLQQLHQEPEHNQPEIKVHDAPSEHKQQPEKSNELKQEEPFPSEKVASDSKGRKSEFKEEPRQESQSNAGLINIFSGLSQSPPEKPKADQPKSVFYVGGVAVESEKKQSQIVQQQNSVHNMTSKLKEEYQRKKKEEQEIKQEIGQTGGLVDILNAMSDPKFRLEKLKSEWNFEFLKGNNEFEVVEKFKIYITSLSHKIIDELGLEERKRYYQPQEQTLDYIRYEVDNVILEFYFNELTQTNAFQEKGTLISSRRIKKAAVEFKNYNYLLQLTKNKGRLRIPLTMSVEYKGFTGFAMATFPETQNYDKLGQLDRELENLQQESRIHRSIFEDEECSVVALQGRVYEKLSRSENTNKKFDFCMVKNLQNYLPQDFFRFNKDVEYHKLRSEFIQDEEYEEEVFYGENMCEIVTRLKLPQHYKQGIDTLKSVSRHLSVRIEKLVQLLENLDEYATNSKELSELVHSSGLNIRYLGLLFEKAGEPWLKSLLMSEIIARCAKYFLKYDLQDCLINLNESNVESVNKFLVKQTVHFLNKLLGNTRESQSLWKQLNKQAQTAYHVYIDRQLINKGYFLQSLQSNCNIKLHNLETESMQFFKTSVVFSQDNFYSFTTKCKCYDLSFTELYNNANNYLRELSEESYEQLSLLLNLKKNSIPQHFKLNGVYDRIILYLVNWLPPSEGENIYYPPEIQLGEVMPSKALYSIKLTQIKWLLKNKKETESEEIRDWIIDHINRWLGPFHPILTDLYDMYSTYYSGFKDQEKKAINYCKSSIKNIEKLLGQKHIKLADNYYLLGTSYINYGKKIEALNCFRRAKEIIAVNEATFSEAYGEVCLKMAQIYLASNSLNEAMDSAAIAMEKLIDSENLDNYLSAVEVVCRCYEVGDDWAGYAKFVQDRLYNKLAPFTQDNLLLDRAIKCLVLSRLHQISVESASVSKRILGLVNELPDSSRSGNVAYNYLKQAINVEHTFPDIFFEFLADIEAILDEIDENGLMVRWKGFENFNNKSQNKTSANLKNRAFVFLAQLEAVNAFLGPSFIEGILSEQ